MSKRAATRLSQLLRIERDALLAGDLDTVGTLVEEKAALAEALRESDAVELRGLTADLNYNSRLLAAAREGVVAVLNTLQQQRKARNSLASYDSKGKATQISPSSGGTERRF